MYGRTRNIRTRSHFEKAPFYTSATSSVVRFLSPKFMAKSFPTRTTVVRRDGKPTEVYDRPFPGLPIITRSIGERDYAVVKGNKVIRSGAIRHCSRGHHRPQTQERGGPVDQSRMNTFATWLCRLSTLAVIVGAFIAIILCFERRPLAALGTLIAVVLLHQFAMAWGWPKSRDRLKP